MCYAPTNCKWDMKVNVCLCAGPDIVLVTCTQKALCCNVSV